MAMRILLISANGLRLNADKAWRETHRKYTYSPTTLTTLASLVPDELGANVQILDEAVSAVPSDFAGADLVAISTLTCNAPRAYELAALARSQGIPVVLGGYHVTFMPTEAAEHADAIVKGFAETSWPALLRDFARGKMQRVYDSPWEATFTSGSAIPRRDLLRQNALLPILPACPQACLESWMPIHWQTQHMRPAFFRYWPRPGERGLLLHRYLVWRTRTG